MTRMERISGILVASLAIIFLIAAGTGMYTLQYNAADGKVTPAHSSVLNFQAQVMAYSQELATQTYVSDHVGDGNLRIANNLSDVNNAATARTNLDVYSKGADFTAAVEGNAQVSANTSARHSHTNKPVLDGISVAPIPSTSIQTNPSASGSNSQVPSTLMMQSYVSSHSGTSAGNFSPSTEIWVDGNYTGTSTGAINQPYKTLNAAIGTLTSNAVVHLAPGNYTEVELAIPNHEVILLGNGSTLTLTGGPMMTSTAKFTCKDLNLLPPNDAFISESIDCKLERFNARIITSGVYSSSAPNLTMSECSSAVVSSGLGTLLIKNCWISDVSDYSAVVYSLGSLVILDSYIDSADPIAINSVGKLSISNSTVKSSATGGTGISCDNSASAETPNTISNTVINASGTAVTCGASPTVFSKNLIVSGAVQGSGLIPANYDFIGGIVKMSLGSDAFGDVYYRGVDGELARLAPGTSGQYLKTLGANQAPVWADPPSETTDATNASNISSGTLASDRGGAGTVSGILKANGSGAVSQAVAGTDYLATSAISNTAWTGSNWTSTTAAPSQAQVQVVAKNIGSATFASNLTAANLGQPVIVKSGGSGGNFTDATIDAKSSNLITAYKFEDLLRDSTGNGNTLVNIGSVSQTTGASGFGAAFGTGTQYFSISSLADMKFDYCAVSAVIKMNSVTGTNDRTFIYFDRTTGGGYGLAVGVDSTGHIFSGRWSLEGVFYKATSSSVISANTQYHVLAIFDYASIYLYVDGSLVASSSSFTGTTPTYGGGYYTIGGDKSNSRYAFNGMMDELYIWRGTSSLFADASARLAFAQALYNSGNGKYFNGGLIYDVAPFLPVANGGTGKTSWTAYSIPYASASTAIAEVAPNTAATKKFLGMTGTGSAGAAPSFDTISDSDLPASATKRLTANTTVTIPTTYSGAQIQAAIDAQPKNLNGYTLTFQFASPTVKNFSGSGTIVGNGTTATAAIASHGFASGDLVFINGTTNFDNGVAGGYIITGTTTDTFTFAHSHNGTDTPASSVIARKAYNLGSQMLNIGGFFGGQLNIYGNTSETNATALHKTQHVVLQGTGTYPMWINNCAGTVIVNNIRFVSVGGYSGLNLNTIIGTAQVWYCSATNSTATSAYNAFGAAYCPSVYFYHNMMSGGYGGIAVGVLSGALINECSTSSTLPVYGVQSTASTVYAVSTQPSGSTAATAKVWGGQIFN